MRGGDAAPSREEGAGGEVAGGSAVDGGERPEGRLRTEDFDYPLPQRLVARRPAPRRDASRLLVVRREDATLHDRTFRDFVGLPEPGDVLALNDTRVFPARLLGRKPTGARVEVLLLRPLEGRGAGAASQDLPGTGVGEGTERDPGSGEEGARVWEALVRPGGKLKPGRRVQVADELVVEILDSTPDGGRIVRLVGRGEPWSLVERHGRVPLPPYIDREADAEDRKRYQTVYAERRGSVAAPTAGLHFTPDLLRALESRGVEPVRLTLHVGVGTFRPVDAERPEDHALHSEAYRLSPDAAAALNEARAAGGRVWAVGTTVCRALETVADERGRFHPGAGRTDLFIHPPYRFRGVDRLLTNFHLPRSSLLMLVAAFAGHELTMRAYRHAVEAGYRFYSYGDAMLLL